MKESHAEHELLQLTEKEVGSRPLGLSCCVSRVADCI
jgi:hypothetical protein